MFVLVAGSADAGRSVLFLHALGLDHRMWQPQLDGLSGTWLVLAPDLPGFGRSRSEPAGLHQASEAIAAVLRERDLRPVVVGVSYGGYVATILAATHPESVSGLIISGVRTCVPTSAAYLQAALFTLVRPRSLAGGETVPNDALANEKKNLVAASRELGKVDLTPFLTRITAPTIVFAPDRDRFVRRGIPDFVAAIPTARVVRVADAGHLWTQTTPEPLLDAIRDFPPGAP
jgi:pimeloyl-ACP methyl ester carboxylesterase